MISNLQENPFDRRPAGLGEIALKLRSYLPQEVKNTQMVREMYGTREWIFIEM